MKARDEVQTRSERILQAFDAIEGEDPRVLLGLTALQDGSFEEAVAFTLCKLAAENKALRRRLEN